MRIVLQVFVVLVTVAFGALFFVPRFRHSVGAPREVIGIVESAGSVETSGAFLRDRAAVVALVRLPAGNLVSVSVSSPVPAGSQVLLRESAQNFGRPAYAVLQVLPGREP